VPPGNELSKLKVFLVGFALLALDFDPDLDHCSVLYRNAIILHQRPVVLLPSRAGGRIPNRPWYFLRKCAGK
jgi:hypothetical protein